MVKTGIVPDRDTGRFVASGTVWQTAREDSRAPANAHGFVLGDLAKIKVLRSTRVLEYRTVLLSVATNVGNVPHNKFELLTPLQCRGSSRLWRSTTKFNDLASG